MGLGDLEYSEIANTYLMGVSAQILQYLIWPAKGFFGINYPFFFVQLVFDLGIGIP